VSLSARGRQSNGESRQAAISASGRFVAFASRATNLVSHDRNGAEDVFLRDRRTGTTRLASVATDGSQGRRGSSEPAISGDGRALVFQSSASNLVRGDRNGVLDIFLRDVRNRTTRLVSSCCGGVNANGPSSHTTIASDGRAVGFNTSATNLFRGDRNDAVDVVARTLGSRRVRVASVSSGGKRGNGNSYDASLSSDGVLVAFDSAASNLVAGDGNDTYDVFLRDVAHHTTRLISVPFPS
jgi:Tol biopolymer transport system component